jgi:histidyl-tRNA synthetase
MVDVVNLGLPRGMRDLDSVELRGINQVRDKFIESARIFNFSLMEPSTLETLDTLEAKGGPNISDEIYAMTDKGGRNIGLRFDLTVGLTRFVTRRRDLKLPVKIGSFGGVWRYDEPQAGRYRYFHQCDVEVYGSRSFVSELEVIEFIYVFLRKLGLDIVIELNHRTLVEEFILKKLEISDKDAISEIFRIMDKVQKKGPRAIIKEYENRIKPSVLEKIVSFSSIRGNPREINNNIGELTALRSWKSMEELMDVLRSRHVTKTSINLGIVRGLDYYSGIVFEAFDPRTKVGALAGGGRYDKLTDLFGRSDMGAVGAAAGVERILLCLRQQNLTQDGYTPDAYVVCASESTRPKVLSLVSNLRANGFATDFDLQQRSLSRQLDDASSKGASVVVIIAPRESERGEVIIKSLRTGKEKKLSAESLINELRDEI